MAVASADHGEFLELGRAVFQFDAALQFRERLVRYFAMHATDVFAFDFGAWMHQLVSQRTVGGQQQQAGGVDVEPADCDPAGAFQPWQLFENGGSAFGIVACRHHAIGLMEHQHLRVFGVVDDGDKKFAVHLDAITDLHAGAE